MTMWLPRLVCSQAGMKSRPAEQAAGDDGERQDETGSTSPSSGRPDRPEAADIGLPSPPMLNRPAWKATATARPVKMKPVA